MILSGRIFKAAKTHLKQYPLPKQTNKQTPTPDALKKVKCFIYACENRSNTISRQDYINMGCWCNFPFYRYRFYFHPDLDLPYQSFSLPSSEKTHKPNYLLFFNKLNNHLINSGTVGIACLIFLQASPCIGEGGEEEVDCSHLYKKCVYQWLFLGYQDTESQNQKWTLLVFFVILVLLDFQFVAGNLAEIRPSISSLTQSHGRMISLQTFEFVDTRSSCGNVIAVLSIN